MAGNGNCRRTAAARTSEAQTEAAAEREVQEVPMCRHVNPTPSAMEWQLCELRRLVCRQNELLCELLHTMREPEG